MVGEKIRKFKKLRKNFKCRVGEPIRSFKIMAIEVIVRGSQGATVVDFHGRLDMYSRWHVKAIINQCCHTELEHLILNLQELTFVDSAGLGFLVMASRQFKELNRRISWIQPQGSVGEVLHSLQLHELFAICQTEQDALS